MTDHALSMAALHAEYAPRIAELARAAADTGEPINRPVWWADPKDAVAHSVDSEFLLGDDLLVAPVLDEGAETIDIYLPTGSWRDEASADHAVHEGPTWLRDYAVDLWTLPYFSRQ